MLERVPFVRDFAVSNRSFLRRAVRWLSQQGIRQFVDIGSGIPTVGNVHEVADPSARTLYVDHEPVAVAHARTILDRTDPDRRNTAVLQADLRAPDDVLGSGLIDFDRPIGLLIVATPGYFRDRAEVSALFDGFELVDPGITWAPEWCPDQHEHVDPAATATLVGIGRKLPSRR